MMAEPHEIELKFALPAERAAELMAALPSLADTQPHELTSVYFDTPKRSLRRAGLALRVRRADGVFVQTLKDQGDGMLTRGEWETTLAGPEPAPVALAKTPAAGILRKGEPLTPQFTVEVARRSAEVEEGGARIELSLDEGQAKTDGKCARFVELELELKAGSASGLFALARRIALGADLTLSFTTKAERGFALVATSPGASKFNAPALDRGMSAGEAFTAVSGACLRQIVVNAELLRRRASPEVVHQLRVGLRRLRSLITTFKKIVNDSRTPALRAELEWLTGELDAARNLDVLLNGDYRAALAQKDTVQNLKELGARLRGARRIAYARAAAAVESERFRRLALDLLIWIEAGPWTGEAGRPAAREPLGRFARKALDRRRRKIVKEGRKVRRLAPAARHRLRIDAKKMRYAADAFAGLYGHPKRAHRFIDALKSVQDCLGELNDLAVGEALAQDVAAGAGWARSDAVKIAGRVTAAHKARSADLLANAQDGLDAFAEAKPFWPEGS